MLSPRRRRRRTVVKQTLGYCVACVCRIEKRRVVQNITGHAAAAAAVVKKFLLFDNLKEKLPFSRRFTHVTRIQSTPVRGNAFFPSRVRREIQIFPIMNSLYYAVGQWNSPRETGVRAT